MRPSIEERVFAGWIKARPIRAYFALDEYGLLGRNPFIMRTGVAGTRKGRSAMAKKSAKGFKDFWKWLCGGPRRINNLGCRGHSFDIHAQGNKGTCAPKSTKPIHGFSKDQALRVWDRYHGARAASCLCAGDTYLRAGTYAKPNKKPSLNSWPECPNKTCAPWIAAAIAEFLGEHPCGAHKQNQFRQANASCAGRNGKIAKQERNR